MGRCPMNEHEEGVQLAQRVLIGEIPETLRKVLAAGEPTWTTERLREDYFVDGFFAPLVAVRRKSDGVRGTLMFSHQPRLYFRFEET
jgi:hypothetical protein